MDGFDALGQVRDLCQPDSFSMICIINFKLEDNSIPSIQDKLKLIPSFSSQVKIIMATNRPDTLDPALLRPGRLDRKIGEKTLKMMKQILFCKCEGENTWEKAFERTRKFKVTGDVREVILVKSSFCCHWKFVMSSYSRKTWNLISSCIVPLSTRTTYTVILLISVCDMLEIRERNFRKMSTLCIK